VTIHQLLCGTRWGGSGWQQEMGREQRDGVRWALVAGEGALLIGHCDAQEVLSSA